MMVWLVFCNCTSDLWHKKGNGNPLPDTPLPLPTLGPHHRFLKHFWMAHSVKAPCCGAWVSLTTSDQIQTVPVLTVEDSYTGWRAIGIEGFRISQGELCVHHCLATPPGWLGSHKLQSKTSTERSSFESSYCKLNCSLWRAAAGGTKHYFRCLPSPESAVEVVARMSVQLQMIWHSKLGWELDILSFTFGANLFKKEGRLNTIYQHWDVAQCLPLRSARSNTTCYRTSPKKNGTTPAKNE